MITVFETFAGIGAQRKALQILKRLGLEYKVVATSEWDVWANINYFLIHESHNESELKKNFNRDEAIKFLKNFAHSFDSKNKSPFHRIEKMDDEFLMYLYFSYKSTNNLGSILEITIDDLLSQNPSGVDLITYSFPCQDLSVAGSVHGFNKGMGKELDTRSGLLWQIGRLLLDLKNAKKLPKYLLLENVRNMLSKKHIPDYKIWLNELTNLGYKTQTYVMEATSYGIPQKRQRVFALSVRNDIAEINEFEDTLVSSKGLEIIEKKNKPTSKIIFELELNKKIEEIIKNDYEQENYFREASLAIPNRTPSRERIFWENTLLKEPFKGVVRTITTKQDRHPNAAIIDLNDSKYLKNFLEIYKNNHKRKAKFRYLTPRETFLLMGFTEDDFNKIIDKKFSRNDILYRQAGNTIVVNCLVSIFNEILKIERKNDK